MELLNTSENTLKLCDYLINALENLETSENNLTPYIKGLKYFCFGNVEDKSCLSFMSPEEKLLSILSINNFDVLFRMKPDDYMNTIDALLSSYQLTYETCRALKLLIPSALKMNIDGMQLMISKLFNHTDFLMMPVDLIEEILKIDSTELELILINLYSEKLRGNLAWNCQRYKNWISFCSKSPELYYLTTVLMNQILVLVKKTRLFLDVVVNFVDSVQKNCRKDDLDFISLYPKQLQSLVSLMTLELDGLLDQQVDILSNCICENFKDLKIEDPSKALIILTHFYKWENYLESNIT